MRGLGAAQVEKALIASVHLIQNEWGYSAEASLDWIVNGDKFYELYDEASARVVREWLASLAAEGGEA